MKGGQFEAAFEYVMGIKGIMSDDAYPYVGQDSSCRYNSSKAFRNSKLNLKSYVITKASDKSLMQAIYNIGPVCIGMYGDCESFFSYANGIYNDPKCDKTDVTHAVVLMGWGSDADFGDYWIIKNTWGKNEENKEALL